MNLTPKQLEVLRCIVRFRNKNGYSPTLAELAERLGVSKVTVFEHIVALEKKGAVRRDKHKARSLELNPGVTVPGELNLQMPLVGMIAAGQPIEAIENSESLDLQEMFSSPHETFVLQVRGDSMIDEHINDGDYVIVEKRDWATNGETIVALTEDGEATLKKFYRERNRIRLQPANPKYEPIYVTYVQIQGVVIGVLRKY
jgi:repressor LexA